MKQLFLLLAALVSISSIHAQEESQGVKVARLEFSTKQVISPSPDAASLGKYGNVPVSLFTGTPNISVPLMEMKGSTLSLPVTLSYNASGFKPDEMASWVGLGWSLNAGGVITRAVIGNPDVSSNYYKAQSLFEKPTSGNEFDEVDYYKSLLEETNETQPDMYYYNFMGHSGRFVIGHDGVVHNKTKDMLKISSCSSCSSFTIVDEKGFTYYFSNLESTYMIPSDEEGRPAYNYYTFNSAWYLTSVQPPDNSETLTFEYYSAAGEQNMYTSRFNNRSQSYSIRTSVCSYLSQTVPTSETSEFIPYDTRIRDRKFLKRATLQKGGSVLFYIDFESNENTRQDLWLSTFNGERMLKKVKMYSYINDSARIVKEWNLNQSYFGNPAIALTLRLRLDNVQEISHSSNTPNPPPYSFTYRTEQTPDRFTSGLDHWGFYNGVENTSGGTRNLIPTVSVTNNFPPGDYGSGAYREANFAGSATALIEKITYPTKGYTVFNFESNDAVDDNNVYQVLGGVRIQSITDYSFDNKVAGMKAYTYNGKTGRWPRYYQISSYSYYTNGCATGGCGPGGSPLCFNYNTKTLTIAPSSYLGLGSIQGNHVVYSQVTETQWDDSGHSLGKTVYNYNFFGFWDSDDHIGNGDLIKKEIYNSGKLISEQTDVYNYANADIVNYRKLRAQSDQNNSKLLCKDANGVIDYYNVNMSHPTCVESRTVNTRYTSDMYSVTSQKKRLQQSTVKVFDQKSNSYLTSTKVFTYDNSNHIYPTKTVETALGNENLVTTNKYAGDYLVPSVLSNDIAFNGIRNLNESNMLGIPIETIQYRENSDGSNRRYINGSITTFSNFHPVAVSSLEVIAPVTSMIPSDISSAGVFTYNSNYKPQGGFVYDGNGSLIEQSKNNDVPISYIWDYCSSLPIAEVTNAIHDRIAYTSFETGYNGEWVLGSGTFNYNNTISGSRTFSGSVSKQVVSGDYIVSLWSTGSPTVNGLTSTAKRNSFKNPSWKYYEWHLSGVTSIQVSSDAMDEVRLYPEKSQMKTFTYDPSIGLTSQMNVNSLPAYYDYDGLGRLVNVKDDAGNIIKNYQYNYGLGATVAGSAVTLYYNDFKSQSFTKDVAGCPPLAVPSSVNYTVPYGAYVSVNSVAEANIKAQAEIDANGQSNANQNGLCIWYNVLKEETFFKNNCLPTQGPGNRYIYTVTAGTYSSLISQADADQKALNEISTSGQQRANISGTCTCEAEGRRFINGGCERGIKVYEGSTYTGSQYQCRYIYVFSDGFHSENYYEYRSTPCPQNN